MAVVHEYMPPVAGQCWMGLGFPAQQRIRINAGAMGLVAELDATEIPFRPFLAGLWITKSPPPKGLRVAAADRPLRRSAPLRHEMPRPSAGCHPRRSVRR